MAPPILSLAGSSFGYRSGSQYSISYCSGIYLSNIHQLYKEFDLCKTFLGLDERPKKKKQRRLNKNHVHVINLSLQLLDTNSWNHPLCLTIPLQIWGGRFGKLMSTPWSHLGF